MNHEEGALCRQAEGPNTQERPEQANRSTQLLCRLARLFASVAVLAIAAALAGNLARDGRTGTALIVILVGAVVMAALLPAGRPS